jgi:CheY-like chemotaxis protein
MPMARILVVDDEPAILTLMRFILEKSGHQVDEAVNGLEALQKLGVEPVNDAVTLPELVVLDLMMPIMDGHKAFLRIRAHARTEKLPVVVVTAKGDMRALFDQMPSVAGFFHKPFDPGSLRAAIAKALASPAK